MADFNDISKCTRKDHASFQSCNCFDVDVATTGYCGGDSGHGGRTYLKLMDADCSDIDFRVSKDEYGRKCVEMMLGGDTELETFIDALRWAANTLETLSNTVENEDENYDAEIVVNWKRFNNCADNYKTIKEASEYKPGVYAYLELNERCLYIGSSKNNMWSRIYDHLYNKEKCYALSDFILIGEIEGVYDDTKINDEDFRIILHQVEDYLIEKYSPRLNKRRISKFSTVYNIKIEEKYA